MTRTVARLFSGILVIVLTLPTASAQHADTARADTLRELMRRIDILAEEIESIKLAEVALPVPDQSRGLGPAASKVYGVTSAGVSLAGYGELVYANYAEHRDDDRPSEKKDQVDYLRNVLYVGFRFNDMILLNSEIEFEHGSTGKGGEVSMEFGYLELMLHRSANLRAGMVLIPVGIVNEKHEPTTFFGTLRPQVEQSIIPSTWRGIGAGAYGEITAGLAYRAYVTEGLNAAGFTDTDGIRGGRQSGARATIENLGFSGRLEFLPREGVNLGASFYAGNSSQGATDSAGIISAWTTVLSAHAEFTWEGLDLRALYAQTRIDNADRVSRLAGKSVGSLLHGWYVVGGYDILPLFSPSTTQSLLPYVLYERLDTQAELPAGYQKSPANNRSTIVTGLMYKPHPGVAFKGEYRDNRNEAGTGVNQWNLAVNYMF